MAVTPPNVPPNTGSVTVTGPEDTPVNVPLTGTDVDGAVSVFKVVVTLPQHGVLKDGLGNVLHIGDTVPATGNAATLTFVPDADWNGTTTFQYASVDNVGAQDATPATGTIIITPVNDPPTTNDTSASGPEDAAGITVHLTGADIDGTVASFTITSLPANGTLQDAQGHALHIGDTVPATGNAADVVFVPAHDWNGQTTFNYASRDNAGASDATPATATVTVTPVNDPPTTNDSSASGPEDAPVTLTLTGADVDGTVASYTIKSLPTNGVLSDGHGHNYAVGDVIIGASATVTFTPDANWNGQTTFTYAATDDSGAADATPAIGTITITPVNDPPTTNDSSVTGPEDAPVTLTLTGADIDGTVAGFKLDSPPANGVLSDGHGHTYAVGETISGASAQVVFTPDANWNGQTTFNYHAVDDSGAPDATPATGTITITPVNDPPTTNDSSGAGAEDTVVSLTLTGADVDGTVASYTITALPTNGVLQDAQGHAYHVGDVVSGASATVCFKPDLNWNGQTTFNYAATDNSGAPDATPATGTITITPVNDPPETYDTSATGLEDAAGITVHLTGSDVDGAVSTFTITSLPNGGTLQDGQGHELHVGDTVAAGGNAADVVFVPSANFNGDTTFNYASHDNGGLDDATPATATITVTPVADPPETSDTNSVGDEDTPVAVSLMGADPDGTVTSFTINSLPDNGVLKDGNGNVLHVGDSVPATGNGATVFFVPDHDWNGETEFDYSSKDNDGLTDATPATASISVDAVNDPPETASTAASGAEDAASIAVNLSGSDSDGTVQLFTINSLPANGVLKDGDGNVLHVGSTVPASGNGATVFFTPTHDWNGDTTFNYASQDDGGANDPTPATATITVTPVNDPPETNNTSATGAEDAASITIHLSGSDVDGAVTSFTLDSLPANGVLMDSQGHAYQVGDTIPATGSGADVFFKPDANWNGDTSFQYNATDNAGAADPSPATATITVTPVNDPPETSNTSASGQEDSPGVTVQLSGSDVDGTVASFTIKTLPTNGTLQDGQGHTLHVGDTVPATDGQANVVFVPNHDWNGDTSFNYASNDDQGAQDPTPATAAISVAAVNDPPDTANTSASGNEDAASITVNLSGSDADGTVQAFTINSLPSNGVLKDGQGHVLQPGDTVPAVNGAAQVFFVPNANWNGTTDFNYSSKDNQGADDPTPGTATITVNSVNDGPDTANSSASGIKGAVNVGLTLTGTDSDGTVTSFTIKSLPANGVLTDGQGHTLSVGSVVTATNGQADVFFTPTATFTGTVNFNYASNDNDGAQDPTPAVGTVVITPPQGAPGTTPPDTSNTSATGNEDGGPIQVNLSGTDADGTVKVFTINSLPTNGVLKDANGNVLHVGDTVAATGNAAKVYFTPNANWNGDTSFNYASKDNDNLNDATPAKATIHVNGVNDGPETNDVCVTGSSCSDSIKVGLSGTDVDGHVVSFTITSTPTDGVIKDAQGHTLTVGSVVTAGSNGTASVYFYPNSHWDGVSTFKYAAKDDAGASDQTPATATIKVAHANDGPETNGVTVNGVEDGGPVAIKITGTDSDGSVVAFKINSLPSGGVLKFNGNVVHVGDVITASGNAANLTFTPNADWNGTTTFQYSAKDNDGAYDSTPATGKIIIAGVNDGPSTCDVSASGCQNGGTISICLSGSDPDGHVVSFTISDLPANGVLKDAQGHVLTAGSAVAASNNGATVYFTPNSNWSGLTTFHYAAKDDQGAVDTTPNLAKITVTAVNNAPTTSAVTATGTEDGGAVKVTLAGADTDGTVVAFKITSMPAGGVFKDAGGNTLSVGSVITATNGHADVFFTPNHNFNGDAIFQYAAKDNSGAYDSSAATGKITITPVNDAPTAVNDSASVTAGTVLKLAGSTLLANDTDPDGDHLSITSVQGAAHGTVALGQDGTVSFTATSGYTGAASFTYTVSDGHGGSATATVNVDVKAASAPDDISGPGVRTQGFWANNGAVYWDGETDPSGTKHSPQFANFPKAELTYRVDTNYDGTVDSNKYLLIGDFNKNGVTDNGEHTFLVSLSDAKALLTASTSDARMIVGRDLVTTWLNYLAENPVGSTANANSPAWFVQEAVDWLSQLSGNTHTLAHGIVDTGAMSNGAFVGTNVSTSSSAYSTGINLDGVFGIQSAGKDVLAGSGIHDALDQYNNTGKIGASLWAHDGDL